MRNLPMHDMVCLLGPIAPLLGAFHNLTECDTSSSFLGKGKKSAWKVWKDYPDLTEAFKTMSDPNVDIADVLQVMPIIEKFIVMLYGVTDEGLVTVNDAHLHLFDMGKDFENLPPCFDSLLLLVLGSTYQIR